MDDLAQLTRLLHAGADPDEFDGHSGWTPLLRAIDGEADGAVQTGEPLEAACTAVPLAYGADPERPSRDGLTPLHLAFQIRQDLAVRLIEAHIPTPLRLVTRPVPTRFPTVVVGCGAVYRRVHLGSPTAGCRCGDGSGSHLNDGERS
ncbi:hypothetical protein OHO81_22990 [Streptomyces pseudovenezuelae]|nr:hypothetical protein [Streptomyces pseudovenezuelae]WUA94210.1 hypothetical protein OHO81_22990 [Streptomyces pseudovenezuelae]